MLVLSRRARRYLLPGVIVVAILLLLFGGTFINQGAVESRLNSQAPITYRLDAWKVGWELFKKSPLVGLGFDNYIQEAIAAGWAPRIGPGQRPWVSSHNMYLYIGTSAGLVGLVPFVVLLAAIGWRAVALWRSAVRSPAIHKDLLALLLGTLFGYVLIIGTFDGLSAQTANVLMFVIAGTVLGAHEPDPGEAL